MRALHATAAWMLAVSVSACGWDSASDVPSGDQATVAPALAVAPISGDQHTTRPIPPSSDPLAVTGVAIGDTIDSSTAPVLPRTRADGTIDLDGMPVWTPVGLSDVVAGYVKTADLFRASRPPADGVIVYDEQGQPIGRLTADGVVLADGS